MIDEQAVTLSTYPPEQGEDPPYPSRTLAHESPV